MRKLLLFVMVIAGIAWIDALYLTYHALTLPAGTLLWGAGPLFCDISSTFSCSSVLQNPYSQIFGLPFPAIAILVYPVIFCIAMLAYVLKDKLFTRILTVLALMGMCFNGYFISIEYFKIGAYCPLCLLCTGIITTIFAMSLYISLSPKKIS